MLSQTADGCGLTGNGAPLKLGHVDVRNPIMSSLT